MSGDQNRSESETEYTETKPKETDASRRGVKYESASALSESDEEIIKPKTKRNWVNTEKRKAQFEQARLKRLENIEQRKKEKLKSILLKEVGHKVVEELEQPKPKKKVKEVVESESEEEEEVVKKPKSKSKKKKIVYESETESSDEDSETEGLTRSAVVVKKKQPKQQQQSIPLSQFINFV